MSNEILVTRENGVLTITIDRPARKNALTPAMYQAMVIVSTPFSRAVRISLLMRVSPRKVHTSDTKTVRKPRSLRTVSINAYALEAEALTAAR